MTQQNQTPERELRAGTICASIWRKELSHGGRKWQEYSIRVQKRYKDERSGEWKTTTYFRPEDLPKLVLVANKAYEYASLKETDGTNDLPKEM